MYGGYYGGWIPSGYLTQISLYMSMRVRQGGLTWISKSGQRRNGLRKQREREATREYLHVSQDDEVPPPHDKGTQEDL